VDSFRLVSKVESREKRWRVLFGVGTVTHRHHQKARPALNGERRQTAAKKGVRWYVLSRKKPEGRQIGVHEEDHETRLRDNRLIRYESNSGGGDTARRYAPYNRVNGWPTDQLFLSGAGRHTHTHSFQPPLPQRSSGTVV